MPDSEGGIAVVSKLNIADKGTYSEAQHAAPAIEHAETLDRTAIAAAPEAEGPQAEPARCESVSGDHE